MAGSRKAAPKARLGAARASMADVAALAGVSAQTVSRVVNGSARVDPETESRVRRAMREVGYRPNTAARALATGHNRMIGVISFDLRTYGNARALEAVVEAAQGRGYSVHVVTAREHTGAAVGEAFDRVGRHDVDGVIVHQADVLDARLALPSGMPVVVIDGDEDNRLPGVQTDHGAGAASAVEHLLGLGHRTVVHLAGPEGSFPARHRARAWRRVLDAAGRPAPRAVHGDWTAESGYRLGRALAEDPDTTAVFVANDQMALGLLRALREAGRDVPGDVSVVGFDNIPESAYFPPPLTTVDQDFAAIGQASVRLLLDQVPAGGRPSPGTEHVAPRLVVRRSTAAPAGHEPPRP
ncbi:LacI family DNA-binding transcriptional regulator [Yinghuangia sp. ASG 101]|uniref:LacI family DNA-binding transcriptional regulator n=1 Tax=Yinghuangia sp. ASG 101 TaxID=2896848 RepID=UPI001E432E9E|nr:LacI family DNA-binding transcriptional regulator [Yinghuangia sp. ASG 101]UGQ10848.1 LacI family DNA-binding transcriptional regulator [Yinghuangia sp. ASG 101]